MLRQCPALRPRKTSLLVVLAPATFIPKAKGAAQDAAVRPSAVRHRKCLGHISIRRFGRFIPRGVEIEVRLHAAGHRVRIVLIRPECADRAATTIGRGANQRATPATPIPAWITGRESVLRELALPRHAAPLD